MPPIPPTATFAASFTPLPLESGGTTSTRPLSDPERFGAMLFGASSSPSISGRETSVCGFSNLIRGFFSLTDNCVGLSTLILSLGRPIDVGVDWPPLCCKSDGL